MPCVPATSSRRSMPPRNVQLTSNWPIAPDSNLISAIALSSSSIGWTSVSVVHITDDRPVPLAHEVADDLDAVAAEVDDRAAAGQPAVPEPGAVRPGVRLAGADPGHVAERPVLHGLDRLERLGRVAQVLEVAAEHARPLDRLEHPLRLGRRAAQRLRAQDRLARRRDGLHGLLVEVVRERDDHDVRLGVADRRLHVGRELGDRPSAR